MVEKELGLLDDEEEEPEAEREEEEDEDEIEDVSDKGKAYYIHLIWMYSSWLKNLKSKKFLKNDISLIEIADKEEVNLNLNKIKMVHVSDNGSRFGLINKFKKNSFKNKPGWKLRPGFRDIVINNCIDIWKEKVKRLKRLNIQIEKEEKLEYELQLKNLLLEEETNMKRRLRIHALIDNGRLVEDEEDINKLAANYYKDLFGPSNISTIHMNNMNMKRLSDEGRYSLTVPFTLEEIHKGESWILKHLHQYGFVKGKYILDCVVSLHEIVHEVNWQFLYRMIQNKGFGDK
ncbi:hypothetical protein ACJX0J_035309 [Zea mays]